MQDANVQAALLEVVQGEMSPSQASVNLLLPAGLEERADPADDQLNTSRHQSVAETSTEGSAISSHGNTSGHHAAEHTHCTSDGLAVLLCLARLQVSLPTLNVAACVCIELCILVGAWAACHGTATHTHTHEHTCMHACAYKCCLTAQCKPCYSAANVNTFSLMHRL